MKSKRAELTIAPRLRGRPLVHNEPWSKVSVVLFDRQVVKLDRLVGTVTINDGPRLTRAGLIRALVDGLIDSGLDLSSMASERELRKRFATQFRRA